MRTCILFIVLSATGCTTTPEAPYGSGITEQCDACLSSTDAEAGCHAELAACTAASGCEDYVLCQLRSLCYESPATGACERQAGCTPVSEAPEAAAFERCARSNCARVCNYEPAE